MLSLRDADSCREYVAANANASLDTLRELPSDRNDTMARFNAAGNPAADTGTVRLLAFVRGRCHARI